MQHKNRKPPTALVILDGFGDSDKQYGNAVAAASMPTLDFFKKNYQHTLLHAAGPHVGLPEGFIGNSEVGHLTLGAGRVIPSTLKRLHDTIDDGSFFSNPILNKNLFHLKQKNKALHLIGLLSDAGVHSHQNHLEAFITLAKKIGVKHVFIHAILDGRDTPPRSAQSYLQRLEDFCSTIECGTIASLHGRFYAMDRDNNWNRIQKTYDVLREKNDQAHQSWQTIVQQSYNKNIDDEFLIPTRLIKQGVIQTGDGIIFFNVRPDRARQLTQAFIDPNFHHFPTQDNKQSFFITPVRYDKQFKNFNNDILFEAQKVTHTLLDEIAAQTHAPNNTVFIIAETEKYAHVTYFFKGMRDEQSDNEQRVMITSIKTKNYINHPEMSVPQITHKILESLHKEPAFFYLINYANADMVGHSGNFDATVKACEILDKQLKLLYEEIVVEQNGTLFITADHGNAEDMVTSTGQPITAHSKNPVPFFIINHSHDHIFKKSLQDAGLALVAPTILKHIGLNIPDEMK